MAELFCIWSEFKCSILLSEVRVYKVHVLTWVILQYHKISDCCGQQMSQVVVLVLSVKLTIILLFYFYFLSAASSFIATMLFVCCPFNVYLVSSSVFVTFVLHIFNYVLPTVFVSLA